jgi:hypothetical protein
LKQKRLDDKARGKIVVAYEARRKSASNESIADSRRFVAAKFGTAPYVVRYWTDDNLRGRVRVAAKDRDRTPRSRKMSKRRNAPRRQHVTNGVSESYVAGNQPTVSLTISDGVRAVKITLLGAKLRKIVNGVRDWAARTFEPVA